MLDEPTSFIDPEAEVEVQRAMSNAVRGRSVLLIAHRLSTVTTVDQIVVLEAGRVVQRGRHEELVEVPGLYRRMWRLQNEKAGVQ